MAIVNKYSPFVFYLLFGICTYSYGMNGCQNVACKRSIPVTVNPWTDLMQVASRDGGRVEEAKLLLYSKKEDTEINTATRSQITALSYAIRYGNEPLVAFLRDQGALLHYSQRVIQFMNISKFPEIVRLLLHWGTQIGCYDEKTSTVIEVVDEIDKRKIFMSNVDALLAVLSNDASQQMRNLLMVESRAIQGENKELSEKLQKTSDRIFLNRRLLYAARQLAENAVLDCVARSERVNICDNLGNTTLHVIAEAFRENNSSDLPQEEKNKRNLIACRLTTVLLRKNSMIKKNNEGKTPIDISFEQKPKYLFETYKRFAEEHRDCLDIQAAFRDLCENYKLGLTI